MQEQGQPSGRPEQLAHADGHHGRVAGVHVAEDQGVGGGVDARRGGGVGAHRVLADRVRGRAAVHPLDLGAGDGGVLFMRRPGGQDLRADDHDEPQRDDGAEVEPGAQHPRAVLVNLEPLDVGVGHGHAEHHHDGGRAHPGLHGEVAAEGVVGDHQRTDEAAEEEQDDQVAGDPVPDHDLVADYGHELEDGEQGGGQHAGEVQSYAGFEGWEVGVPVAWGGVVLIWIQRVRLHGGERAKVGSGGSSYIRLAQRR